MQCRNIQSRRSSSCRETDSHFTLRVENKSSLRNSRMQHLSTYSKGKEILKSVTIIEASLYCQLLGRSLQESYWIDWMNTLNCQGLYQKASVDSGKDRGKQTWYSQQNSFNRNDRNTMWTSTCTLSTLPKHSTQSVLWDWKNMAKFGCPAKFIVMVRQFHDGMLARVESDGEFSD